MPKPKRFLRYSMLAFASSMALAGCASSSADVASSPKQVAEYMQAPQQYDIYALDCRSFVTYTDIKEYPYCILLATDITPQKITFTVADAPYKTAKKAKEKLKTSSSQSSNLLRYANLNWDVTETHVFSRSTLAKMYGEEKILTIKRLNDKEIQDNVKAIARRPL